MAGHSHAKNIMHRKGKSDAIRSKVFSKLAREITVAAKMGVPDPSKNARLRLAVANARAQSMPKDNIERAIKKASGAEGENYDEIRYEGYGPGVVAVIVETLTDNRNRTGGDLRSIFSKNGGALGESNSVSFMFERVGRIVFPAKVGSADQVFEAAVEAGAADVQSGEETHEITTAADDVMAVRDALVAKFGDPLEARQAWRPQNTVPVEGEAAETLFALLEALDENDDVQSVAANYEVSDEVLQKLAS